jgi:hypothetical protein
MGIRSDVAVCLKAEIFCTIPQEIKEWMDNDSDDLRKHPEGVMYVFTEVKWYLGSDKDIERLYGLYSWLEAQDIDTYYIVTACSEYPEDTTDDRGNWYDNPWNVCKLISVSLQYDET